MTAPESPAKRLYFRLVLRIGLGQKR